MIGVVSLGTSHYEELIHQERERELSGSNLERRRKDIKKKGSLKRK